MRPRLLLVDDDIASREMLAACLAKQGFDVAGAGDAVEMRQRLHADEFHVVLLDINLPGTDGLTLARELRLVSKIGIIMLTAREGETDRVLGLEWGADDYVTKQIPLTELIARIRALLRRIGHDEPIASPPAVTTDSAFGGWSLNNNTKCLITPAGGEIKLTKGEFDLLSILCRNKGKAVARSDLLAVLSGRDWSGNERSIDVLVGRLRRKLGDDPRRPRRLITVHGTGYRLVGSEGQE